MSNHTRGVARRRGEAIATHRGLPDAPLWQGCQRHHQWAVLQIAARNLNLQPLPCSQSFPSGLQCNSTLSSLPGPYATRPFCTFISKSPPGVTSQTLMGSSFLFPCVHSTRAHRVPLFLVLVELGVACPSLSDQYETH